MGFYGCRARGEVYIVFIGDRLFRIKNEIIPISLLQAKTIAKKSLRLFHSIIRKFFILFLIIAFIIYHRNFFKFHVKKVLLYAM